MNKPEAESRRATPSCPAARIAAALLLAWVLVVPCAHAQAVFGDGFESGNTLAWTASVGTPPLVAPEVFRSSDLDLRDPHLFIDTGVFGCFDFTDTDLPLGLGPSFNASIETAITTDGDLDGFLDLSFLDLFRPLDTAAAGARLDLGSGLCTAPAATTVCALDPMAVPLTTQYDGSGAGSCLGPIAGTTSGYSPVVPEVTAPCFASQARPVLLTLQGVTLPLDDFQVGATFADAGPTELTPGLMRGFLRQSVADSLLLPPDLPLVGGQPLSVLLPGGTGNCAAGDDRDLHAAELGWWFYLEGPAVGVPYSGD